MLKNTWQGNKVVLKWYQVTKCYANKAKGGNYVRTNLKRKSPEVIDTTSDNETRSIIFLDNNKYCISSVNASVLAKRAQNGISEIVDENKD